MSTTSAPSEQLVLWGKRHQFIQGFDPLGMQATPTATYSYLLPGITNPTNRIRYYGFFNLCRVSTAIATLNPTCAVVFRRMTELLRLQAPSPTLSTCTGPCATGR